MLNYIYLVLLYYAIEIVICIKISNTHSQRVLHSLLRNINFITFNRYIIARYSGNVLVCRQLSKVDYIYKTS